MKFLTFVDLNKNELRNPQIHNLGTAPSSPVLGQLYFDTSGNVTNVWNGTTWHDLRKVANAVGSSIVVTIVNGIATIDISPATQSAAGSMSAADKLKLDEATANATASKLVIRDSSGNAAFNTVTANKVTGLATPVALNDAATKDYVDTLVTQGIKWKATVRVATTANITLSGLQVIDGVTLAAGNRVLVKNQTTATANGIYVVAVGAWTRATDLPAGAFGSGMQCWIDEGTTQADTSWVCTNDSGGDVVGTAALAYVQNNGTGGFQVDATITKTGNQIGVTGYTYVSGATVARKVVMTGNIGGGSAATFTHNLNTTTYEVQIFDNTTNERLYADIILGANAASITANGTALSVRVVVIG